MRETLLSILEDMESYKSKYEERLLKVQDRIDNDPYKEYYFFNESEYHGAINGINSCIRRVKREIRNIKM